VQSRTKFALALQTKETAHATDKTSTLKAVADDTSEFTIMAVAGDSGDEESNEGEDDLAADLEENISEGLDQIDFSSLDAIIPSEINETFGFEGISSYRELVSKIITGEITLTPGEILSGIVNAIKNGFVAILAPLIIVVVLALLFSVSSALMPEKSSGITGIIRIIITCAIITILVGLSSKIIANALAQLSSMQSQMNAVFPIMIALAATIGGAASVTTVEPSILFLTNIVSNVFSGILFSLFTFTLVLTIVDSLSQTKRLSKFKSFLNSCFKGVIGVVGAVYIFVLGAQGLTSAITDNLSIRAAKYTIKNYIPYLGGYISDGLSLVKMASILIKNGIGLGALIVLVATALSPILEIVVFILALKLIAGVMQIVGASKFSDIVDDVGKCFKMLVAIVLGVAIMFFLTLMFMIRILNIV